VIPALGWSDKKERHGLFTRKAPFASYEEVGSGGPLLIPGAGLNSTIANLATAASPFNPIREFKGDYRCIA
jgi:hypothetical protein